MPSDPSTTSEDGRHRAGEPTGAALRRCHQRIQRGDTITGRRCAESRNGWRWLDASLSSHLSAERDLAPAMNRAVDIVMPVFNEGGSIRRVLDSLKVIERPARVLICYDFPEDDTLSALRDYDPGPLAIELGSQSWTWSAQRRAQRICGLECAGGFSCFQQTTTTMGPDLMRCSKRRKKATASWPLLASCLAAQCRGAHG